MLECDDMIVTLPHVAEACKQAEETGSFTVDGRTYGYDQAEFKNECGTTCCAWGGARLLAGLPLAPNGPSDDWIDQSAVHRRLANLFRCSNPAILPLIAAEANGWPIDEALLTRLFDTGDVDVRCALARRPDLPEALLTRLFETGNASVLWALANRPDLPEALLTRLLDTGNAYIRCALADRPDLPEALLTPLFETGNAWVRYALARRPDLPEAWKQKLCPPPKKGIYE